MTESLAVSPDVEAFYCYALVLLVGLIAGKSRVSHLLGDYPGTWGLVETWLLFSAYALLPVLLFWFLDRTNALHDTSLFAAILVGVGYQPILSGNLGGIRAPGDVSKFWQPFQAWANRLSDRILSRIHRNSARFDEQVIRTITSDAQQLDRLKKLALIRSGNPQQLQDQFAALDTPANVALWGQDGVIEKQASLLYQSLKAIPDSDFLLYKAQIVTRRKYLWYAKEWRGKTRAWLVTIMLVIAALWGAQKLLNDDSKERYCLWRTQKANATPVDRFRAKEQLLRLLKDAADFDYARITRLLRYEALPLDIADRLLAILIESREVAPQKQRIEELLLDSLRAENPDIRGRIQSALVYLADERKLCFKEELRAWKPAKQDSATTIDERIKEWREAWRKGPSTSPCP